MGSGEEVTWSSPNGPDDLGLWDRWYANERAVLDDADRVMRIADERSASAAVQLISAPNGWIGGCDCGFGEKTCWLRR